VTEHQVLAFTPTNGDGKLCDVPIHMLVVGDLKFYAQILGRENMSSFWCMWCSKHPSEWSNSHPTSPEQLWTIQGLKAHKDKILLQKLKDPKDISGVVTYPVWDFIEPSHYIIPILHVEIGLVNNALDNFYNWVEDYIEVASPEEKLCRNKLILLDTEVQRTQLRVNQERAVIVQQLSEQRYTLSQVKKQLKSRTVLQHERISLLIQEQQLGDQISLLVRQRKEVDAEVGTIKKKVTDAKADLKEVRKKKKKLDNPILAELENVLNKRNICAAAYHGGKLNGVDCRELISIAEDVYSNDILPLLLSVDNPDRCSESLIENSCKLHQDIFMTLDALCSLLRMKNGEPQQQHFEKAETHLLNLRKLWQKASLSLTPKMHTLLNHSIQQMRAFEGIGDTMEDDVEMMHQISARIESRVGRMNNKGQQAFIHSKMESITSNVEVKGRIKQVKQETTRTFKK
jgi:hypothetical protein